MERKGLTGKTKWLFEPLNDYCVECLYLICAMLIVRIAETIALFLTGYHAELIANNLIGFAIDMAHIGWIVAALFIIYLILSKFSQNVANITTRIIFAAYLCVSMLLVGYFVSTHMPLDGIITAYSPRELFVTIKSNSPYNLPIAIAIIILAIIFAIIPRKKFRMPTWLQILMIAILAGCAFFPGLDKDKFRLDKEYYIIENKTAYLCNNLRANESIIQLTDSELKEKSEEFASYFPDFEFVDYHYPFLHKDNTPDVLSAYIERGDTRPNIVIIIVEGLCSYISGENSTATSATPFLDSLSQHALVWENCLSTSERTFGVLPSILGALPFGGKGFLAYRRDVPEFNTLATILHANGYKNTFFYGGWYGFDSMDIFAENNFMEMYYDKPEYKTAGERSQWGLRDEYMLLHSLDDVRQSGEAPRLDIYLTLSTHDPFDYPDKDRYTNLYNEMQTKQTDKTKIKKLIDEHASFIYADECLQKFFDEYKKCKSFDNTIFVITGDHKFITSDKKFFVANNETPTENFQVPLIIWSPMLKTSSTFKTITTHRNITPSILALLRNNYGIKTPENSVFLNCGLDTSQTFAAKTFSPHINADRSINGLTYNKYYIQSNSIFRYDTSGILNEIKTQQSDSLKKLIELYSILENYIMNNDALVKD